MTGEEVGVAYKGVWALTQQMLEAARGNDWDRLTSLEQERSRMLGRLAEKNHEDPAPLDDGSAEIVHNVLACDQEIKTLTEAWLAELQKILDSQNTERKLFRTYHPEINLTGG